MLSQVARKKAFCLGAHLVSLQASSENLEKSPSGIYVFAKHWALSGASPVDKWFFKSTVEVKPWYQVRVKKMYMSGIAVGTRKDVHDTLYNFQVGFTLSICPHSTNA